MGGALCTLCFLGILRPFHWLSLVYSVFGCASDLASAEKKIDSQARILCVQQVPSRAEDVSVIEVGVRIANNFNVSQGMKRGVDPLPHGLRGGPGPSLTCSPSAPVAYIIPMQSPVRLHITRQDVEISWIGNN